MADEQVKLKELFLSSRRLRFLHLKSQDEIVLDSKLCGSHPPLFLGADVLSNCSISVANLPRTHAKYSKKGLATKVNFPTSVRLNGIQGTSKGVWFYSIQGLFRVAFEMYSREEQLEVLKRLQAVWTVRFVDPILLEAVSPSRLKIGEDTEQSVRTERDTAAVESQRTTVNNETSRQQKCKTFLLELEDLINTSDKEESEYDVISTLRTLLSNYKTTSATNDELSKLNPQERMLCTVCHWIGKQFRGYKDEISHQVTEFKKRHIATIDNLPPAETVIKELFPQSMIVLLKTWMEVDASSQRSEPQMWLPFPLMQLILEFANQTLVSGVSHVLYSRLMRSDSV